ncbi:MAG: hypothetical protein NTU74_20070 [Deltaproteobacteria bacterium]|nr:hypothetical protein [Deltaproteobacteria bacterium]
MTENNLNEGSALHSRVYIFVIILLSIITRIFFLLTPAGRSGDADEAVFGMMAQAIVHLKEYPIIFWEAHYSGAPVAYVAAIIFKLFGDGFVQLHLAMMIVVLPGFLIFYHVYRRLFGGQVAFVAVLFLIFCPYLVLRYTTGVGGGYGESFLGTALIILLSWNIKDQTLNIPAGVSYFLLGLTSGFFAYVHFYVLPAILVFAVPVLWSVGVNRVKLFWRFCLGGFVGIAPLIIYNFLNKGGTLTRAAAWILLIGRDDVSAAPMDVARNILLKKGAYLAEWFFNAPLMFGQYVMPSIFGHKIQIVAGFLLIILFVVYIVSSFKEINKRELVGSYHRQFALYLLVFILFQWMASLHVVRHFMPIFFVIPIALFSVFKKSAKLMQVSSVIVLLLCTFQVIGWVQASRVIGFDARPVVKVMENQGIREFYSSYWIGYPIMFLADGRLIGSPILLPYHEPFGERRPQYTEQVVRSRNAAFIFGDGEEAVMNDFLSFLNQQNITSTLAKINGVSIFYHLSKPVGVSFNKTGWSNSFFLK